MKYKIKYFFDGYGEVEVEADNEEEAREMFFSGEVDFDIDKEWGDDYSIERIEEIDEEYQKALQETDDYYRLNKHEL
jgi:hypothetical protein